jgi:hypothetical protein
VDVHIVQNRYLGTYTFYRSKFVFSAIFSGLKIMRNLLKVFCNIFCLTTRLQMMSCAAQVEGVEGGSLHLSAANLPDTVLWNPWQEKVCNLMNYFFFKGIFSRDEYFFGKLLIINRNHLYMR